VLWSFPCVVVVLPEPGDGVAALWSLRGAVRAWEREPGAVGCRVLGAAGVEPVPPPAEPLRPGAVLVEGPLGLPR
jgi:hypothetical protein